MTVVINSGGAVVTEEFPLDIPATAEGVCVEKDCVAKEETCGVGTMVATTNEDASTPVGTGFAKAGKDGRLAGEVTARTDVVGANSPASMLELTGLPSIQHCVNVGESNKVVETVGATPMVVKSRSKPARAYAPTLRLNHCRVSSAQSGVESSSATNSTMLA